MFHRRHRKLLQGPFSESSLKPLQPIVEARVNLAIDRMAEEMKTRGAADVFKWWLFVSLLSRPLFYPPSVVFRSQPLHDTMLTTQCPSRWPPMSLASSLLVNPSECWSLARYDPKLDIDTAVADANMSLSPNIEE